MSRYHYSSMMCQNIEFQWIEMPTSPTSLDEAGRLDELRALQLPGSPSEPEFDNLTQLASEVCDTPVALISFVEKDRIWFKSRVGFADPHGPREHSFCSYAIEGTVPMVVEDATADQRFLDNVYVRGPQGIRFYAGVPLMLSSGHAVGTLCVIDHKVRTLSDKQIGILKMLALQVTALIEAKRTTLLLQESEYRWRFAIEGSGDGLWDWDIQNNHVFYSEQWLAMLGLENDATGHDPQVWSSHLHPEDKDHVLAQVQSHLDAQTPHYANEHRVICKDGSTKWMLGRGLVVQRDADGRPLRMIGTNSDITGRKQAEEALLASKERMKFLLSSSPAIIYTCEAQPPYAATYISKNITELMGFHPDQFIGNPGFWADRIHPEDSQRIFDALGELFVHDHHDQEYRFRMADGTYHWIFDRVKVTYSKNGEPEQLIGYWTDIDDRKRAEAELRENEKSHRELFESNPHPMWVYDLETLAFIAVNDAAIRKYGYSQKEFLAMTIKDIRPPEDVPRLLDNIALVSEGIDEAGFWDHYTKDGRVITVEITSHTLKFNGRNAELVLAHDVTERKLAELALKASNAQLQLLETCVSRLNDIVLITEAEPFSEPGPRIVFANDAFMRRTGFSREEVIGKTPRILQGPKTDRKELDRIRAAMERWEPVRAELLNYTKSGEEFWIELDIVPIADPTGWFTHWVAVERDVTERKQVQFELQNSLQDKTALLMEVHHRVKNNLQVVSSLLRMESRRNTVPAVVDTLQNMQGRILAMAQLHESIYRSGTFASIDLGAYLRQVSTQAFRSQAMSPELVNLKLDLGSVLVGLDQATVAGLLLNELISNCLKHGFPQGRSGQVLIVLEEAQDPDRKTADRWRLRICDTGVGLPNDFEQRRENSLGLQLASDLSGQLGGSLVISSSSDGTQFSIEFVAMAPAALAMPL